MACINSSPDTKQGPWPCCVDSSPTWSKASSPLLFVAVHRFSIIAQQATAAARPNCAWHSLLFMPEGLYSERGGEQKVELLQTSDAFPNPFSSTHTPETSDHWAFMVPPPSNPPHFSSFKQDLPSPPFFFGRKPAEPKNSHVASVCQSLSKAWGLT